MLLSKEVEVRWNGKTRAWYEERGYAYTKQNDFFTCKIEDVMKTSPIKVLVKCDYCGQEFLKPYRDLFKQRELVEKDCCSNRKCMVQKSDEINIIKYGVKNHMQTKESKEHASKMLRTDFKEVKKLFESKNLTLLSNEEDFKNRRSKLRFICNNHIDKGEQITCYEDSKRSKHCCQYGSVEYVASIRRINGEDVYNEFINKGLKPLFKPSEYTSNMQDLPYICPRHEGLGIQYKRYSNLMQQDGGCPKCSKERAAEMLRLDRDMVFKYFNSRGLIVLDKEYLGKDEHINFECEKHIGLPQRVTYNGLKKTKCPCLYCREERNLSKISRTVRSSLSWWRKASKKKDKSTCILTGIKGSFEIHHQYQLDNIIQDALRELGLELKAKYTGEEIILVKEKVNEIHKRYKLGVCLNKDMHILFHIKYGKQDCTEKDFCEFMVNYFNGVYDDELDDKLKSINSKMCLEEAKKLASFYYAQI